MTNPTVNVFYIGTLPILDTVQGNGVMENATTLLGNYSVGTDIVYHTLRAQHDPRVVDGLLATNDFGASALNPDGLYDEGFSNTVSGGYSQLDSQQLFLANVTFRDIDGGVKTMVNVPMNVYQLENGDTYMTVSTEIASPTSGLVSDPGEFIPSILSGRDLLSVELTTLRSDPIGQDNLIFDHESIQDTVSTFYLGNKSILDTVQGNGTMENAGSLLGGYNLTSGSVGSNQFAFHTLTIRHDSLVNDELLATNDFGASALNPDGLYDEGFANVPSPGQNGTTFSELDAQQLFFGNIHYMAVSSSRVGARA